MTEGSSRNASKKGNNMLDDKIKSRKFNHSLIKELPSSDLKISLFQEHGFTIPVLVKDKSNLGMRLPSPNFTVSDIKQLIGSSHIVEVKDSPNSESSPMSMKDLVQYFNGKKCDSVLSVACFEYSFTDLECIVDAPSIVTSIDWLYQAWPEHMVRKPDKDESPSYPQLQRFCIMTVAGSFTDFHFDAGGTSVWYHVFRGHKIVWMIPPTNENCELFEKWCASSSKSTFFGDEVKSCQRFTVDAGSTLFIPSGWIHAIYSPVDSLTFSGNFLHSYAINEQLNSYDLECRIKKTSSFPFFCEMQWYLLERYVDTIGHVTHRAKYDCDTKQDVEMSAETNRGRRARGRGGFRRGSGRKFYNRVLRGGTDASDDRIGLPKRASVMQKSVSTISKRKPTRGLGRGKRAAISSTSHTSSPSSGMTRAVSVKLDDLRSIDKTLASSETPTTSISMRKGKTRNHLCPSELSGLNKLVSFLEGLPVADRHVPQDIPAPDELLHDAKVVLAGHAQDDPKLAVTGRPVLASWKRKINFADSENGVHDSKSAVKLAGSSDTNRNSLANESLVSPVKSSEESAGRGAFNTPYGAGSSFGCRSSSSVRRRRVRCRKCEACTRSECGECSFCKDMKKFGGLGKMKQTCISRQCLAPMLPTAAVCVICGNGDDVLLNDDDSPDPPTQASNPAMTLMECNTCWKIVHPQCLRESYPQLPNEGVISDDMPNSWECPKCCHSDAPKNARPRINKGAIFASKLRDAEDNASSSDEVDSEKTGKLKGSRLKKSVKLLAAKSKGFGLKKKRLFIKPGGGLIGLKRKRHDENEAPVSGLSRAKLIKLRNEKVLQKKNLQASPEMESTDEIDALDARAYAPAPNDVSPQLASLVIPNMSAVRKYVVRPAPIPPPPKYVTTTDGRNHVLDMNLWVLVFSFLDRGDLARCMDVCKTWNRWGYDRRLWRKIDLSRRRIRQTHLIGIVRRQPWFLDLSWTNVSHAQLRWLVERLPHVRELRLAGNSWPAVSALCGCRCPLLVSLDVAWVSGIYDACIRDLISTPRDHRPGLDASSSRLRRCTSLVLAGTDITDEPLEAIARHMPLLEHLDLSYCVGIGDDSVRILSEFSACQTLVSISLTGSIFVTNACFRYLDRFKKLRRVSVEACPNVDESTCLAFGNAHADCAVSYKECVRLVK